MISHLLKELNIKLKKELLFNNILLFNPCHQSQYQQENNSTCGTALQTV